MKALVIVAAVVCLWIGMNLGLDLVQGTCHTHSCWERVRQQQAWELCKKRHGARYCTFRNRFDRQPASWRRYYGAVIACEQGRFTQSDPDLDGSGFIWRAEWSPSTARAAGLSTTSPPTYHEEGLAVISWTKEVGFHVTRGWPNCP